MSDLHGRLQSDYAELQAKHKSAATRQASIRRLQRLLAPHLPLQRQEALDLGAGQGELVEALLRLGFAECNGVELSPSQVQLAQAMIARPFARAKAARLWQSCRMPLWI